MSTTDMNAKGEIERRVSKLVQLLPPLEADIEGLFRAISAAPADHSALESLISQDPGLCAVLMMMAHDSCYSGPRGRTPVQTIADALARVPPSDLVDLVGTAYAFHSIQEQLAPMEKTWAQYLQHSREIAGVCAVLAGIVDLPESSPDRYRLAGLTHDIGRLVIMVAARSESASLLGTSPDQMASIVASEQAAYGLDHCRLGYEIFRKWRFADVLCDGILRHHSPLIQDDFSFPGGLIFVSHFVTMNDFTGDIVSRVLPSRLLNRLGLAPCDFDEARKRYAGQ